jgi:hypothetical protein
MVVVALLLDEEGAGHSLDDRVAAGAAENFTDTVYYYTIVHNSVYSRTDRTGTVFHIQSQRSGDGCIMSLPFFVRA